MQEVRDAATDRYLSPEETKISAGEGCYLEGLPGGRGVLPGFSEAKCPSV